MHYIDTKNERSCATASHPGLKIAMDFLVTDSKQEASNAAAHDQECKIIINLFILISIQKNIQFIYLIAII